MPSVVKQSCSFDKEEAFSYKAIKIKVDWLARLESSADFTVWGLLVLYCQLRDTWDKKFTFETGHGKGVLFGKICRLMILIAIFKLLLLGQIPGLFAIIEPFSRFGTKLIPTRLLMFKRLITVQNWQEQTCVSAMMSDSHK